MLPVLGAIWGCSRATFRRWGGRITGEELFINAVL